MPTKRKVHKHCWHGFFLSEEPIGISYKGKNCGSYKLYKFMKELKGGKVCCDCGIRPKNLTNPKPTKKGSNNA